MVSCIDLHSGVSTIIASHYFVRLDEKLNILLDLYFAGMLL